MSENASIHELLPWYVARTLDTSEEETFRNHLASCPDCREEMKDLEKLRAAAAEHGSALFSTHPGAERLVAAVVLVAALLTFGQRAEPYWGPARA